MCKCQCKAPKVSSCNKCTKVATNTYSNNSASIFSVSGCGAKKKCCIGPRGPQGPAGPAGPTGPAGPGVDQAVIAALQSQVQQLTAMNQEFINEAIAAGVLPAGTTVANITANQMKLLAAFIAATEPYVM